MSQDNQKRGGPRDLYALKQRLIAKATATGETPLQRTLRSQTQTQKERNAIPSDVRGDQEQDAFCMLHREREHLRGVIRGLYQDAIETEDARDFTSGVQEQLEKELISWGEKPMSAQEYMEAQEEAAERAKDEADFERLRRKLGR